MRFLIKIKFILLILSIYQTGCSIDSSLSIVNLPAKTIDIDDDRNRIKPDFVAGELAESSPNFKVRAAIGEIPEEAETTGGFKVRGVFYE